MRASLQNKCENTARHILSKTDPRYWQQAGKLRRWERSAGYCVEIQFRSERHSVPTHSGDKQTAAKVAARIYADLLQMGWPGVLAKYKASTAPLKADKVATIGEWITAAKTVSSANIATFNQYAVSLRKIVGDILAIKRNKKRFGARKGGAVGAAAYRAAIDKESLAILSPGALQQWRIAYVKTAKTPRETSSRMTSCNSTIQQARSLFGGKITKYLPELRLPDPTPFSDVDFYPRQSARYQSKIDPVALFTKAQEELAEKRPALFLTLLLGLATGLRRAEIDTLCWPQVDLKKCTIQVEATDTAALKTADSRGDVEFDPKLAPMLQGFKALATGRFVIESEADPRARGEAGARSWGRKYRATRVFDELIDWLRNYKQDGGKPLAKAGKPIHELRKECGALITQKHGIYAASLMLRHSNVATTAAHYADKKESTAIDVGAWLNPKNVIALSVKKLAGSSTRKFA